MLLSQAKRHHFHRGREMVTETASQKWLQESRAQKLLHTFWCARDANSLWLRLFGGFLRAQLRRTVSQHEDPSLCLNLWNTLAQQHARLTWWLKPYVLKMQRLKDISSSCFKDSTPCWLRINHSLQGGPRFDHTAFAHFPLLSWESVWRRHLILAGLEAEPCKKRVRWHLLGLIFTILILHIC